MGEPTINTVEVPTLTQQLRLAAVQLARRESYPINPTPIAEFIETAEAIYQFIIKED